MKVFYVYSIPKIILKSIKFKNTQHYCFVNKCLASQLKKEVKMRKRLNIFFYVGNLKFSITFLVILICSSLFSATPPSVTLEEGYYVHGKFIIYPVPDNITNTIEVGPGKEYEEIHNIPIENLDTNTLVKIFYREEPYRTQTFLSSGGAYNQPLRIQGIPNANGILPIVTAENAVLYGDYNQWTEDLGTFVISGSYGEKPSYIELVNLHIKGELYAGIWAKSDYVSIKGCILENNFNGVFFQANNQNILEISTNSLIEGCWFKNNGEIGSYLRHNIYSQGYKTLIQFNTIDKLRDGSIGSSLKDRSAHTVVRYNVIETSARTIDLVEPEDTDQVLTIDEDWDEAYVYGNLLLNLDTTGGGNMVHYGFDNVPTYSRAGNLYFVNNTVIIEKEGVWNLNLFDVNHNDSKVYFSNNIAIASGMTNFNIFRNRDNNYGELIVGTSWISSGWNAMEETGANSDIIIVNQENFIEAADPSFVDYDNSDYKLEGNSLCLKAGQAVPLASGINLDVGFEPIYYDTIVERNDSSSPTLGCFAEHSTSSIFNFQNPKLLNAGLAYSRGNVIHLRLNLNKSEQFTARLYTPSGRLVKSVSGVVKHFGESISITHHGLSKGYYVLQVSSKNRKDAVSILLR